MSFFALSGVIVHHSACRTVTSAQTTGISKFVDNAFDSAYQYALDKGDLPEVRWVSSGRIRLAVYDSRLYIISLAPHEVLFMSGRQCPAFGARFTTEWYTGVACYC